MYTINEKNLDILLLEGNRMIDKLHHIQNVERLVPTKDIRQFGDALLEVQTEARRQLIDPRQMRLGY